MLYPIGRRDRDRVQSRFAYEASPSSRAQGTSSSQGLRARGGGLVAGCGVAARLGDERRAAEPTYGSAVTRSVPGDTGPHPLPPTHLGLPRGRCAAGAGAPAGVSTDSAIGATLSLQPASAVSRPIASHELCLKRMGLLATYRCVELLYLRCDRMRAKAQTS